MDKKVLVIDTDNATEVMDFVDQLRDMDLAQAKTFIDNSSEPGKLLAEFEVNSQLNCADVYRELIGKVIREDRPVRVLILEGEKT